MEVEGGQDHVREPSQPSTASGSTPPTSPRHPLPSEHHAQGGQEELAHAAHGAGLRSNLRPSLRPFSVQPAPQHRHVCRPLGAYAASRSSSLGLVQTVFSPGSLNLPSPLPRPSSPAHCSHRRSVRAGSHADIRTHREAQANKNAAMIVRSVGCCTADGSSSVASCMYDATCHERRQEQEERTLHVRVNSPSQRASF